MTLVAVVFVLLAAASTPPPVAAKKTKDYYEILGVPRSATDRQIKKVRACVCVLSACKKCQHDVAVAASHPKAVHVSTCCQPNTHTQAFRKQSLKYHPDKNPDKSEKATELFAKLNKAYQVLSGWSLVHSGGEGWSCQQHHALTRLHHTARPREATTVRPGRR